MGARSALLVQKNEPQFVSNLEGEAVTRALWWPDADRPSEFLSPPLVVGGHGSSATLPVILSDRLRTPYGGVLVAIDDVVLASGLADPALKALRDAGYEVVVTSGFGSEPTAEVIDRAAHDARRTDAAVVVGIGGGSVLDSSKLLSLLIRNDGGASDWLGPVDPPRGIAPMVLIPTTCGTGSEATRISMVTVDGSKRASSCAQYIPAAVILDPLLVSSLPSSVIASTGMDALAHAVESLMSTNTSPMSAHHALRAIDLLVTELEPASVGDPSALSRCLWASHLAGQALNAGVVLGHSLAYSLAYEHPMPHGTSCALALPYCIAYNAALPPALAAHLARALTRGRSADLRAAAEDTLALVRRLGLPATLCDVSISPEAESRIVHRILTDYPRPNNPKSLDSDRLGRLLAAMRTGDLNAAFDLDGSTK